MIYVSTLSLGAFQLYKATLLLETHNKDFTGFRLIPLIN